MSTTSGGEAKASERERERERERDREREREREIGPHITSRTAAIRTAREEEKEAGTGNE